jgi:acetoin utilization deacetylase AcuC-like enzyme
MTQRWKSAEQQAYNISGLNTINRLSFLIGRMIVLQLLLQQTRSMVTDTASSRRSLSSLSSFFRIYYNDVYRVTLPPNHRFPMMKYEKVRKLVEQRLPKELFCVSPLSTREELETTHDPRYIERFLTGDLTQLEIRNVGFPWSLEAVDRALSSTGGTVAAAVDVMEKWEREKHQSVAPWAAHVAGGTHHAFYDRGEGFCVFSDIAVAANVVLNRFPHLKILILDLDVHQGNGNAVLFQDNPSVFTFSLHCAGNYFSPKQESDLDIELPINCNDETYLITLHHWLRRLKGFDLIFFQAGVDVLATDRLGKFSLTNKGVARRNELVYQFARDCNVPFVITMGGGYPKNNDWTDILQAHANVYIQAYDFLEREAAALPT